MISIKNERELEVMRRACKITAAARALAGDMVRPGVTTGEIDRAVHDFIVSQGAVPTFLGYGGFPASTCISVNEVVIHGIPGKRVLKEGDIVSVDVGATWGGFVGDCAATYACGKISPEAQKLISVTRQSFFEGIKFARQGCRISDIGHAVQTYVEKHGFGVVRAFVGHGVGEQMHEEPEVPNFGAPGRGPRMVKGMTIAVEPMVTEGTYDVRVLKDRWTTVTADGKLAAHYENTILITDGEPEILTVTEGFKLWKYPERMWSFRWPDATKDSFSSYSIRTICLSTSLTARAGGLNSPSAKSGSTSGSSLRQTRASPRKFATATRYSTANYEGNWPLTVKNSTVKTRGLFDLGKRRRNRT